MPEAQTTAYNSLRHFFDLRDFSDLCGPSQLADVLIKYRRSAPGGYVTPLTDAQVRRLIELAYVGSLRPEEGRYPAFRLFAYHQAQQDDLRTLLRFEPPFALNSESLRKLAPTFSSPALALRVDRGDGIDLLASALIQVSPAVSGPPGRPEFWTQDDSGPYGLMLRVERPGELLVHEGMANLRLRGGRITELASFISVPHVTSWLTELGGQLGSEIVTRDSRAREFFGGQQGVKRVLQEVWAQVLREVITARHGGAFVLIPPSGTKFVRLRYTPEPEGFTLRSMIEDHLLSAITAASSVDPNDLEKMRVQRGRLREAATALPQLANVDGCVLMTRQLDLLGFGGVIKIPKDAPKTDLFDATTGEARKGVSPEQFGGTRHQSAFELAQAVPDSLVFVVSQDGDLQVFSNRSDQVHAFSDLDSGMFGADQT